MHTLLPATSIPPERMHLTNGRCANALKVCSFVEGLVVQAATVTLCAVDQKPEMLRTVIAMFGLPCNLDWIKISAVHLQLSFFHV